jgi:hypothetical protein
MRIYSLIAKAGDTAYSVLGRPVVDELERATTDLVDFETGPAPS